MDFSKQEQKDWFETIKHCWEADPAIVMFSRNFEYDLESRVILEVEALLLANPTFKLYDILDDNKFVGYFGFETQPNAWLTTFFILPKFRTNKEEIWNYIISHLPNHFFTALFKINHRAIRFLQKNGGEIIGESKAEDKPVFIFEFKR